MQAEPYTAQLHTESLTAQAQSKTSQRAQHTESCPWEGGTGYMYPNAQMQCVHAPPPLTNHLQAPCTAATHGSALHMLHARPHKCSMYREIHKHTATLNTLIPHCPTPPLKNTTCHVSKQRGPTDTADWPATTPHTIPEDTLRHNAIHNFTNTTHSECGHPGHYQQGKERLPTRTCTFT